MGLQMTLQVKGVQIAKISALTIRNMLRGVNELVCAEYGRTTCKLLITSAALSSFPISNNVGELICILSLTQASNLLESI